MAQALEQGQTFVLQESRAFPAQEAKALTRLECTGHDSEYHGVQGGHGGHATRQLIKVNWHDLSSERSAPCAIATVYFCHVFACRFGKDVVCDGRSDREGFTSEDASRMR